MDVSDVAIALKPLVIALSMAVFLGLVAYVFWPRRKKKVEAHGLIPLKED